jgi:hypothetical protein
LEGVRDMHYSFLLFEVQGAKDMSTCQFAHTRWLAGAAKHRTQYLVSVEQKMLCASKSRSKIHT